MRLTFAFFVGAAVAAIGIASCSSSDGTGVAGGFGGDNASNGAGAHGAGGGEGGSSNSGITLDGSGGSGGANCPGATTCAASHVECGDTPDGCGGILHCGDCPTGQICGGGGEAGKCGGPTCTPKTCTDLGANCGPIGDGCGNMLDCGTCTGGDTCGGGGMASQCGTGSMCTPTTCAAQAVNCGPIGDGCGGTLQCGTCPAGQTCGGGNVPSVCGAPPCVPKTCANQGVDCGPVGDGCGGLLQCGTCSQPKTCGGGGQPSVCGVPTSCTGLCLQQVTCSNPAVTTTVSGTVYAPNGTDPLVNALVYVPNAPVLPFTPGVSCEACGADASGSPLVSAVTGVDGTFTLSNVPVGSKIPLVIQLGRWRRQVQIPNVASCVNTAVSAQLTRLPRNKGEGDIPLMAFSTGAVDALECVLRKIGVDDAEFTAPSGGGRIQLYEGLTDPVSTAAGGAKLPTSPSETQLWGTQAELNQYDMIFFPCQADQATTRTAAEQQRIINYANAGGRIFATHFSYVWLYNDAPFSSTADWEVEQHPSPANQTGYIDMSFPKGLALAEWLQIVHASTTLGQIPLQVLRHDHNAVIPPSQAWMTIDDPVFPDAIVHYTFNTPVGSPPAQQCGRVLFDDFHVENVSDSNGMIFPSECAAGGMTAQEKLLEFMIFDLASCVTPDHPSGCTTQTCNDQNINCGPAGDGCGGLLQCGTCPAGQTCGGGGNPGQCGAPTCNPKTCQDQGIQCGPAGDGCGNEILCGACPSGQTCGGGGMPGVCGAQMCTPQTCAQQGIQCGPAGDGCGNLIQCGNCTPPQTCGGGGMPGVCGAPMCTPKTCAELGANCGPIGDGCGNVIQCGMCQAPQTCGGGGTPSQCGGSGPK